MGRVILTRGALGLLAALLLAYVGDSVQLRMRLAMGGPTKAYDTVMVIYAAGLKNSKLEIYANDPMQETCARAFFPQMGYPPCWYVRRNSMQMIN